MNRCLCLAPLLALLLIGGCAREPEKERESRALKPDALKATTAKSKAPSGKRFLVGVSLVREDDAFHQTLKQAMQEAAAQNNLELDIWSADSDPQRQRAQVEHFLAQQYDAVLLCPADPAQTTALLQRAHAAAVPVFTLNTAVPGGEAVSHIASDQRQVGRWLAQRLAQRLQGRGSVAILSNARGEDARERRIGFREEMARRAPGIRLLEAQSAIGGRAEAQRLTGALLAKQGRSLNAVFSSDNDSALGALDAARQAKRNDLWIAGYSGAPDALPPEARAQMLLVEAVPQPDRIGRAAIQTVALYLKGDKDIPKRVPVPYAAARP
jgi:ABC-type sugar transport system substrate-binding protein